MTQPPFHTITNKDIYDKLVSVETAVHDMGRKVDSHQDDLTENSAKIRALEIKVYGLIAGLVAAIGILIWGGSGL